VIKIERLPLPDKAVSRLADETDKVALVDDHDARLTIARVRWRSMSLRAPLRETLGRMAPGLERCMYCGDNQGTDIDHHEPMSRNPLRTFDWLNHLLACSLCNSHCKGDRYPVDAEGAALLIDPTVDDPFEHMTLALRTGGYVEITEKGDHTIRTCRLNREILTKGRVNARAVFTIWLRNLAAAGDRGDDVATAEVVQLIHEQPFADVCQSMLRQALSPTAEIVFGDDPSTLALLRSEPVRARLLR